MKVEVELPERIADIFNANPDVMIKQLHQDHGLTQYQSRIYHWIWKNGQVNTGLPVKVMGLDEEIACRHAIMAGLKIKNLPKPFQKMVADLVMSVEDALERPMEIPLAKDSEKETACLVLSDWHSGKQIFDDYGRALFNKDILAFRIACLRDKVVKLLTHNIRGGTIDEVCLFLVGDMADGSGIYPNQTMHQDLKIVSDQITVALAGIWDIARAIRKYLGVPVKIRGVKGNHGRQQKETPVENNFDLLLYQMLYMLAKYEDPEVDVFYSTTTPYLNVDVKGWNVHLRHEAPPQTETPAARAKFGGWQSIHDWDIFVNGHLHHPGNGTYMGSDTIMNGSPVGMDDLSESMAKSSRPSQTLFGIDPDVGLSFKYNVYLDKFGKGGEADEMLKRYPTLKPVS